MKPVNIVTEYITLGQMLKVSDCIDSGGQAKAFLAEATIHVNGEPENRRGRKLYRGDRVVVKGHGEFEIV
jgi:ribosome-associated protein